MDEAPVGHCFVNNIEIGNQVHMHLHLWDTTHRKKGMGVSLLQKSIPVFFKQLQLLKLWGEPYAKNIAPNKTILKARFTFVKSYTGIPGTWCFEQEVNQCGIKA